MSKAIDKMKKVIAKMPESKEKQPVEQGIKNLETFEAIADGFEKMLGNGKMAIYTEPKLGIRGYECFCLGILSDDFETKEEAYQWIIKNLVEFLDLYVDWNNPDNNLLKKEVM